MGTNHEGVNFGRRLPPTGGQFSTLNNNATDGDPAIGRVDVQLVPDPGGGMALGVALGADIAGPRQVRQHLRKAHRQLPFQPAWLLRLLLSLAGPPCAAASASLPSASLPSASAPASPALQSPSHPARCAPPDGHPSSAQSASHADGWPDRSRQTRKRPAKTSPRSEAGRHRSSRTAGIACRQPQDARSGRASSERRTRPWL